jgi:hypothetical protein
LISGPVVLPAQMCNCCKMQQAAPLRPCCLPKGNLVLLLSKISSGR